MLLRAVPGRASGPRAAAASSAAGPPRWPSSPPCVLFAWRVEQAGTSGGRLLPEIPATVTRSPSGPCQLDP